MRNLLALLAVVAIAFAAIGYHQGWYSLNFTKNSDGSIKVETDVNTQKVVQDSGDAVKNASSYLGTQLDKAGQDAKAGLQPTPAATPAATKAPDPKAAPAAKQDGVYLFGLDLTPKK